MCDMQQLQSKNGGLYPLYAHSTHHMNYPASASRHASAGGVGSKPAYAHLAVYELNTFSIKLPCGRRMRAQTRTKSAGGTITGHQFNCWVALVSAGSCLTDRH
jgi:hypothetical protein